MRFAHATLACACVLTPLTADEADAGPELRFGFAYGIAQESEYESGSSTTDIDADHYRFTLSVLRALTALGPGRVIAGAGVFKEYSSGAFDGGSSDGNSIDTDSLGALVEGGYDYQPASLPRLRVEGALQFGYLHQGVDPQTAPVARDVANRGYEVAIRASAFYALADRWSAGFDLRWLVESETEGNFQNIESVYATNGLSIGVTVAYRL